MTIFLPIFLHKREIETTFVSVADITAAEITPKLMNNANNALTEAVFYILLVLTEPKHGYGIMQQVQELSHGRLALSAGTLYGALASLQEKGWIEPLPEEGRKKEYRLTDRGRTVLEAELERLSELVENGKEILKIQTR